MPLGENIKRYRKLRGLTQEKLAKLAHMSRSYLADVERDRYNPSVEVLETLANVLGVSTEVLLGRSIGALVENRMNALGMSWEELSGKTGIPAADLQSLDNKVPDPEDYEPDGLIDRLAKVLDMDRKILADAYARQERPAYDGPGERARGAFAVRESTQTANKDVLSSKEERDIARELERIMSSLESNSALAFDGEPLTEEDKELLRISLENSLRLARQIAKKKFTPHKHRN